MARRMTISTFSTVPRAAAPGAALDEQVQQVIAHWQGQLARVLPDRPDLILLPEVCDMPSNVGAGLEAYLEARGRRAQEFFASVARRHRCHIAWSSIGPDEAGVRRNTLFVLDRSGAVAGRYHKRHVVVDEYENWGVRYGDGDPVIDCDFGRIGCAICFDLYFDEARRRVAESRPDLVLFPSMVHGGLMQAQWAYACRAHFVAALHIMRPSAIIAPTGQVLASTSNYFDYVTATINLDCMLFHLDFNRPKIEAARARYGSALSVRDPGYLGAVLLSSESDERSIHDIAREFELEPLDGYLDRSRAHRKAHLAQAERGGP